MVYVSLLEAALIVPYLAVGEVGVPRGDKYEINTEPFLIENVKFTSSSWANDAMPNLSIKTTGRRNVVRRVGQVKLLGGMRCELPFLDLAAGKLKIPRNSWTEVFINLKAKTITFHWRASDPKKDPAAPAPVPRKPREFKVLDTVTARMPAAMAPTSPSFSGTEIENWLLLNYWPMGAKEEGGEIVLGHSLPRQLWGLQQLVEGATAFLQPQVRRLREFLVQQAGPYTGAQDCRLTHCMAAHWPPIGYEPATGTAPEDARTVRLAYSASKGMARRRA